jgi:iron complex outermembrane receptor protein
MISLLFVALVFQATGVDSIKQTAAGDAVFVTAGRLHLLHGDETKAVWTQQAGKRIATVRPLALELSTLPGVYAADRENLSVGERFTVRGMGWRANFGVRGMHVRYNGFPLTMPDGQSILSSLDPDFIQRMQFSPASSGLMWGGGSNGVLELDDFAQHDTRSAFTLQSGAFGYRKSMLTTGWTAKKSAGRVNLSWQGMEGFRENSRSSIVRYSFSERFERKGVLHNWSVLGEFAPVLENPGALTLAEWRENPSAANPAFKRIQAGKASSQTLAGYRLSRNTMEAGGWLLVRNLENPLPFAGISVNRQAGGFWLNVQDSIGKIRVIAGADGALQTDFRSESMVKNGRFTDTLLTNQQETFVSAGVFAGIGFYLAGFDFSGNIRLSPSAGWLNPKDGTTSTVFYVPVLPQLTITRIIKRTRLFVSAYTSYDTPTLNEWSAPAEEPGGPRVLKPERSTTLEAGVTFARPRYMLRLTGYTIALADRIGSYESTSGSGATMYQNEGGSRHQGVEIVFKVRDVQRFFVEGQLSAGRYTFTGFALEGKALPGVPEVSGSVRAGFSGRKWNSGLQVTGASERFADNSNTVSVGSYSAVHATFTRRIMVRGNQEGHLSLLITNLMNTSYSASLAVNAANGRFYEPSAPRSVRCSLSWRW